MSTTIHRPDGESLTFDAATISIDRSAQITDHPVEKGALVTDHIRRNPNIITIIGTISASPWPDALWEPLSPTRLADARRFFDDCAEELLIVENTELGTFEDYALARWPTEWTDRAHHVFALELRSVTIAEAGTAVIAAATTAASAAAGMSDSVDAGEQATTSTADAAEEADADQSVLFGLAYGGA